MAHAQPVSPVQDPLLIGTQFPFRLRLYPLGFPVDLATNSEQVVEAAEQSWGRFRNKFAVMPLQIRLGVTPGSEAGETPVPTFRAQEHLVSIVGDAANFAVCDYTKAFAYGWLTSDVVANMQWFRWFYLDAIVLTMLGQLYLTALHAACVSRNGNGVLLCGPSGSGKSTLSYGCARRGWTFVCDDSAFLFRERGDRRAIGRRYSLHLRESALELLPELRGRVALPSANGKLTIEVPLSELPHITTAGECEVRSLVFLNRQTEACPARLRRVDRESAFQRLAQDTPMYDAWVNGEQMRSLRRLTEVPAYELTYRGLDDAVDELERNLA